MLKLKRYLAQESKKKNMCKKFFLVIILIAFFVTGLFAQKKSSKTSTKNRKETVEVPADFKSDGCTKFPDGNYRECCVAHDKDYYKGGSWKDRLTSDNRLYSCVRKKKGWKNKFIAPMMWLGVRVFGGSIFKTSYSWGFGKRLQNEKKKKKKNKKNKKIKDKVKKPKGNK